MEKRRLLSGSAIVWGPLSFAPVDAPARPAARPIGPFERVFLTGNSMTDGLRYGGLSTLLGRDDTSIFLGRQTGPGFTQANNFNLDPGFTTSGIDPTKPAESNPFGDYASAFEHKWDALTLQTDDRRMLSDTYAGPDGVPRDESEITMSLSFMTRFAAKSRRGQVFIYSRPARRTDIDENGNPTGQTFDYSADWLKNYDETDHGNFNFYSRSFFDQFIPLLRHAEKKHHPTRKMLPVRLIPGGEAFYIVDQMIKAGKFDGTYVHSIEDFYADRSHPRGDTGSYLLALTVYSSLTGHDPRGVAPPQNYLTDPAPGVGAAKVQALIQEAVYEAMTYSGYAGWTTPINSAQSTHGAPAPTVVNPTTPAAGVFADHHKIVDDLNL